MNRDYKKYLAEIQDNVTSNPKIFWKFIRDKKKQTVIPGKLTYGGTEITDAQDIVDMFRKHFSSVFNTSSSNYGNDLWTSNNDSLHIHIAEITEDDIRKAIKKLKTNSCAGLDAILAFFLKDCSNALIAPLHYIFNKCILTGIFSTM